MRLTLTVNGDRHVLLAPPNRTLLDLLREELNLTGSKHGCDIGDCGACTVLVDGQPVLSCITLAHAADGRSVETIEGVAKGPELHPIQREFDACVASQCGYCTPGFVLNLKALFEEKPAADEDALREALGSNICRCTGYTRILEAARRARDA